MYMNYCARMRKRRSNALCELWMLTYFMSLGVDNSFLHNLHKVRIWWRFAFFHLFKLHMRTSVLPCKLNCSFWAFTLVWAHNNDISKRLYSAPERYNNNSRFILSKLYTLKHWNMYGRLVSKLFIFALKTCHVNTANFYNEQKWTIPRKM